jgi:hypothetical protein
VVQAMGRRPFPRVRHVMAVLDTCNADTSDWSPRDFLGEKGENRDGRAVVHD